MLHSRCSSLDVASSKDRINASTNDMIGRPALKSFALRQRISSRHFGFASESPWIDIDAEVHAWLPSGLCAALRQKSCATS